VDGLVAGEVAGLKPASETCRFSLPSPSSLSGGLSVECFWGEKDKNNCDWYTVRACTLKNPHQYQHNSTPPQTNFLANVYADIPS